MGYLIDVMYKNQPDAFKNTVLFLYSSVDLTGEDKAIALQSIDTLKTVVCDQDLIPRITQLDLLPQLLEKINFSIQNIMNQEYMDFLNDFLVSYGQVIDDKVIFIAHSIVQRIQRET